MQNDTLTALLLDPFLTFDEVVRQVQATPTGLVARLAPPRAARPVSRHAAHRSSDRHDRPHRTTFPLTPVRR